MGSGVLWERDAILACECCVAMKLGGGGNPTYTHTHAHPHPLPPARRMTETDDDGAAVRGTVSARECRVPVSTTTRRRHTSIRAISRFISVIHPYARARHVCACVLFSMSVGFYVSFGYNRTFFFDCSSNNSNYL